MFSGYMIIVVFIEIFYCYMKIVIKNMEMFEYGYMVRKRYC